MRIKKNNMMKTSPNQNIRSITLACWHQVLFVKKLPYPHLGKGNCNKPPKQNKKFLQFVPLKNFLHFMTPLSINASFLETD